MTALPAFCMPWHVSQSNAFEQILAEPLRDFAKISLTPWNLDPSLPLRMFARDGNKPLIFCQLPPPPELLREDAARIIWLPMWDNVVKWPLSFWEGLPKHLRIVAYCRPVQELAERFGLATLRVRFFLDPEKHQVVRRNGPRTMVYWNRVGLFSPDALRRICRDLDVQRLVHILRPDPGYDHPALSLPDKLDATDVATIRSFLPDKDHRGMLDSCEICLAPRAIEGVGVAALQSMVRGACVLAYDGPAVNEYISHGKSGFLFRSYSKKKHKWRKSLGKRWHRWIRPDEAYFYHMVGTSQVGEGLRRINPGMAGQVAREEHEQGHARWQDGLGEYADFLTRW